MAFKFQRDHSNLAFGPTGQISADVELDPWLAAISRGGLIQPRPEFVETIRRMEVDFDIFHKGPHSLDHGKGVIKRMHKVLCDKYSEEEAPRAVILKYVRFKTFVRLKHMNLDLAIERAETLRKNQEARQIKAEERAQKAEANAEKAREKAQALFEDAERKAEIAGKVKGKKNAEKAREKARKAKERAIRAKEAAEKLAEKARLLREKAEKVKNARPVVRERDRNVRKNLQFAR